MDLNAAIAENQGRVEDFVSAAKGVAGSWNTPVRPGKWSPAEVTEHVIIAYMESADIAKGTAFRFPKVWPFLRPLAKMMAFDQVMKTGKFRPVKTFKQFIPAKVAANPDEAAARLRKASGDFEAAMRSLTAASVSHPLFGTLGLPEYVQFQGYHTRHHQAQLRNAG